ncbi:hypothetical protein CH365_16270 [Leptospira neocaledonica]|uniref:Uncharacterized protein n=1 Tax=Leptospira neocaledonica TaxID=2023192 RepID=A0A2M9ZVC7_9LEPT|nr:hypothetical protein CH365_16270 [Leptospira neocaledonica]
MTLKKTICLLSFLFLSPVFGQEKDTVLSFETEQEYVDFVYSLQSVLVERYPKSKLQWVFINSSQYETDLNNVIALANADFKQKINHKFVKQQKEPTSDLIKSGKFLIGKRKTATEDQAIWITIVGYDKNGLFINDSKKGPFERVSFDGIESAYFLK